MIFQGRSSDFRFVLVSRLPVQKNSGCIAKLVPGYSGGPVPDLHRVPY